MEPASVYSFSRSKYTSASESSSTSATLVSWGVVETYSSLFIVTPGPLAVRGPASQFLAAWVARRLFYRKREDRKVSSEDRCIESERAAQRVKFDRSTDLREPHCLSSGAWRHADLHLRSMGSYAPIPYSPGPPAQQAHALLRPRPGSVCAAPGFVTASLRRTALPQQSNCRLVGPITGGGRSLPCARSAILQF